MGARGPAFTRVLPQCIVRQAFSCPRSAIPAMTEINPRVFGLGVARLTGKVTGEPATVCAGLTEKSFFLPSSARPRTYVAMQAAGRRVAVRAADRPLWNPGNPAPEWLDGSLPGDYGFDPLGLGSDPETLKYFVQAELVHGRFAMLGAAGIVVPGLLTKMGMLNVPDWYVAGEVAIKDSGIPLGALLIVQTLLMGWAEGMRIQDFKKPGSQGEGAFLGVSSGFAGGDNGYPGGFFDPMGMASPEMQLKEIKNGRLAMVAMFGFYTQYNATGKGPIDNLFEHMANPGMVCLPALRGVSAVFFGLVACFCARAARSGAGPALPE